LRITLWFGSILTAITLAAGWTAFAQPKAPPPDELRSIDIVARPFDGFSVRDRERKQFGALTFRGGLVLSSADRHFGGFSGLRIDRDGRGLLAVSDRGQWLRATIEYQGTAPSALSNAEMAPILDANGQPLANGPVYDAESVARAGDTAYVGFERVNRVYAFDFGRNGLRARGRQIPVPSGVRRWPRNQSIECLAVMPEGLPGAGTLIAISEGAHDADGNLRASTIGKRPIAFTVRRSDEYAVTDCVAAPDGGLFILERRFAWTRGIAMRIRRLSLADVKPRALLDGPVLMTADMGYQIDNMEGLALHRESDGTLVLTLMSDDNFWAVQRTLLLQFAVTRPHAERKQTERNSAGQEPGQN